MKLLTLAVALAMCTSVCASATITDEFVQVLKDHARDKAAGTPEPKRFFVKLNEMAGKGDPSAQFLLGLTLLKADPKAAGRHLASSAASGCAGAEAGLGLLGMLGKDFAEGVRHFQVAAAHGDAMAQVALSGLHERGEHGLAPSLPKAYAWLLVAERQTVSAGALQAIQDGKSKLEAKMSPAELIQARQEFSGLQQQAPKVAYYFCGQFNIDTSLAADVPSYFKLP